MALLRRLYEICIFISLKIGGWQLASGDWQHSNIVSADKGMRLAIGGWQLAKFQTLLVLIKEGYWLLAAGN